HHGASTLLTHIHKPQISSLLLGALQKLDLSPRIKTIVSFVRSFKRVMCLCFQLRWFTSSEMLVRIRESLLLPTLYSDLNLTLPSTFLLRHSNWTNIVQQIQFKFYRTNSLILIIIYLSSL
ncbi:hypothetical protein LINPERPRIM_LOCUS14978, partial [Linum perenne]